MAVTSITLLDPASGIQSIIKPRDGVAFQGFEFDPSVREVAEDRVGGHGAVDTTKYLGAGVISLTLRLFTNTRAMLDELAVLCMPHLRPVLLITDDEWPQPRQVMVRFDSAVKAITTGMGRQRDVQLSFKAPAGLWEAAVPTVAVIGAFSASTTGISITAAGLAVTTAGVIAPATSQLPQASAVNNGSAPAAWTAMLYGPCSGPAISNDTTGDDIQFTPALVLDVGDFLLLDSAAHTALLNGDPASSAMSYCNFTTTTWWQIQPGENLIRYWPSSASPGSVAQVSWRSAWLA